MTLLEMSVVIMVLLGIVGVLFVGAQAWMRGASRTTCIMHISMVQRTMRGYSNLYNFAPGQQVTDLLSQIIGPNRFIQENPVCPAQGVYTFGQDYGVNTVPPMGELYMKCSLATVMDHSPEVTAEW